MSYFAPAYYRLFATIDPADAWGTVVDTVYDTLAYAVTAANGNQSNGLVPAWCDDSHGSPCKPIDENIPNDTGYQYDSCRTPFRIGLDWCWNGEPRAQAYVALTSTFFGAIGAQNIADTYAIDGTPMPQHPGGHSAAFVGPAGVGAMSSPSYSRLLDDAYTGLATGTYLVGGTYYEESWTALSLLMMTGNFLDSRSTEEKRCGFRLCSAGRSAGSRSAGSRSPSSRCRCRWRAPPPARRPPPISGAGRAAAIERRRVGRRRRHRHVRHRLARRRSAGRRQAAAPPAVRRRGPLHVLQHRVDRIAGPHRLSGRIGQHDGVHRLAQRAEQRERRYVHARPILTAAFLARYDVLIVQWLVDGMSGGNGTGYWSFSADELAALKAWVEAGGGLITLSGYDAQAQEVTPLNQIVQAVSDLSYGTADVLGNPGASSYCLGESVPLGGWVQSTPLGKHIDEVGAFHGRPIDAGPKAVVDCTDGTNVYAAHEDVGQGHVFTFTDEWVTYTSQWFGIDAGGNCADASANAVYQVPQFWYNALTYASQATQCPFMLTGAIPR